MRRRKEAMWQGIAADLDVRLGDLVAVAGTVVKDCEKSPDPKAVAAAQKLSDAIKKDSTTGGSVDVVG